MDHEESDHETYTTFYRDYFHLIRDDDEYSKFVIAACTLVYFASDNRNLCGLLAFLGAETRIIGKPDSVWSYAEHGRFQRDMFTKRGLIKFLARETPCDCMKDAKRATRTMEKLAYCWGCRREFPKLITFICDCKFVNYCSRECQLKDWPEHKEYCIPRRRKRHAIAAAAASAVVAGEEEIIPTASVCSMK